MPILTSTTGQAGFVSALESGLTADALWGGITPFATLMITVIVFAFSYRIVRRLLKGTSQGTYKK